jgi:hypothetical protein
MTPGTAIGTGCRRVWNEILSSTSAHRGEFNRLIYDRTILRIGYSNNEGVGKGVADHTGLIIAADDLDATGQAFGRDGDIAPATENRPERNK